MENIKQINIKNQTCYFSNDMINFGEFDSSLLKIDKRSQVIDIHNIGYIATKKIDEYENIHSVNPLYLMIHKIIGHIDVKNENELLVFDSTDKNKEVFKKYKKLWDGIKNQIETIISGFTGEYGKDLMKIKFDSDDDLPLNKQVKFPTVTVVVRSVFEDEGKFYPQVYLDQCLFVL